MLTIEDYVLINELEEIIDGICEGCGPIPIVTATPILIQVNRLQHLVDGIKEK